MVKGIRAERFKNGDSQSIPTETIEYNAEKTLIIRRNIGIWNGGNFSDTLNKSNVMKNENWNEKNGNAKPTTSKLIRGRIELFDSNYAGNKGADLSEPSFASS